MHEPFTWRGLTFQWDDTESRYVCGRWTVGQPLGGWRGIWSGGSVMIAGRRSESTTAALEDLRLELNETCESYRQKVATFQWKVDLIRRDVESLDDVDSLDDEGAASSP